MTMPPLHSPGDIRLILASRSPRRVELLRRAGYAFEQVESPFDDSGVDLGGLSVEDAAAELAERKAAALARRLGSGVVLGADTLLSRDGRAIGKPAGAAEARRVLAGLIGRTHRVITAVCLIDAATGRRRAVTESAAVSIGTVEPDWLERHIASGAWRGKAGGYNLEELRTADWPVAVEGDETTVVGLPMERLRGELRDFAGIEAGRQESETRGSKPTFEI